MEETGRRGEKDTRASGELRDTASNKQPQRTTQQHKVVKDGNQQRMSNAGALLRPSITTS